jgi:hypothetical protein
VFESYLVIVGRQTPDVECCCFGYDHVRYENGYISQESSCTDEGG